MDDLPHIITGEVLQIEFKRLHALRKNGKLKIRRAYSLSPQERAIILSKTGGKCHICGQMLLDGKFEADHVTSFTSGGTSVAENFLPACQTCNNYRWHYLSEEFRWILKLGVWIRTEIEKNTPLGNKAATGFIKKEMIRESRRKKPRSINDV